MNPLCAGCDGPAVDALTVHYRYPREEFLPEAADPWYVIGATYLLTCGSPACGATALLAALDEVITNAAFAYGRLLDREDLDIIQVGHPEDLTYYALDDDGEES